jgi:phosphoribosylamine---glycine ligase
VKILMIDKDFNGLDWALQCLDIGHEVRAWVKSVDGERNENGDGLVPRVNDWRAHMGWADIIFLADNTTEMKDLESYRRKGYPIFGPGIENTSLEIDRKLGQDIMHDAGMEVMDHEVFTDYDAALKYVKTNMQRYVSKPFGDDNKASSYVAKSVQDMVFMLERWKSLGRAKQPFILQKFTPGIEFAVGGWFGKNGFSKHFCENFEHKKLMVGDIGVNTLEMGTCLKYVQESKLADMVLKPLTGVLHRMDYRGFIDVSVMIDKRGHPLPLEFTCRPGWPCFTIQTALHMGDPAQWMWDLMNGKDTLEVSDEIATGIVLAMPDFPYSKFTKKEVTGFPIYGKKALTWDNIHLSQAKMGVAPLEENGKIKEVKMPVTCGDFVAVVSGTGDTVSESSAQAYKTLKKVELPNSPMYRTDIGKRLEEQIPELQKFGFATDWKY